MPSPSGYFVLAGENVNDGVKTLDGVNVDVSLAVLTTMVSEGENMIDLEKGDDGENGIEEVNLSDGENGI